MYVACDLVAKRLDAAQLTVVRVRAFSVSGEAPTDAAVVAPQAAWK